MTLTGDGQPSQVTGIVCGPLKVIGIGPQENPIMDESYRWWAHLYGPAEMIVMPVTDEG